MQGLTETRAFPGLAGRFGFNKDGDGVKDICVMMVKGGRWVQVEHVPAQGDGGGPRVVPVPHPQAAVLRRRT
jgi:hypothetical protein